MESNYGKSTFMTGVIKLLALEEILEQKNISEIFLNSSDSNLQRVIHKFCKEKSIRFFLFRKNTLYRMKFSIHGDYIVFCLIF